MVLSRVVPGIPYRIAKDGPMLHDPVPKLLNILSDKVGAFIPSTDVLDATKTREGIKELPAHAKGKAGQQDLAFRELFFDLEFSALPVQVDIVISTDNISRR